MLFKKSFFPVEGSFPSVVISFFFSSTSLVLLSSAPHRACKLAVKSHSTMSYIKHKCGLTSPGFSADLKQKHADTALMADSAKVGHKIIFGTDSQGHVSKVKKLTLYKEKP